MPWNIELPDAAYYTRDDRRLESLVNEVCDQDVVAIDTETTGLKIWQDMPLFWSMAWGTHRRICMPIDTIPVFKDAFRDAGKRWVFANAKFDMHMLANVGIEFAGDCVDTAVMHALLHEEESHALKDMANKVLGWRWTDFFDTFKPLMLPDSTKAPKQLKDGSLSQPTRRENIKEMLLRIHETNLPLLVDYASNDAYGTLRIYEKLLQELRSTNIYSLYPDWLPNMEHLFFKTEVPFTKVLYTCERNGIYVDRPYLQDLRGPMWDEHEKLRREMVRLSGDANFNPNSTEQLRDWFIGHEGLKPLMMTKGGKSGVKVPSIDKGFLEHYEHESEMAGYLMKDRKLTKLIGTYIDGADEHMDPNSRIHTRFNQDVARCMPAGELVLTDEGYIPVEAVKVDDLVRSHAGVFRRVVETSVHPPCPIYHVHLRCGRHLRTTGNHQYYTGVDWIRADRLVAGGNVLVHLNDRVFTVSAVERVDLEAPEVTYGLTVEIDHSHVTGGIVTHNTGRLSSSGPNLQNIPQPDKDKYQLRGAFQATPGADTELIVGDYSQLEMRLLACATATDKNPQGAREMIQIFLDGKDIHMGNAEMVFGPIIKREQGWDLTYDFLKEAKKVDTGVKEGKLPKEARTARHALAMEKRNHIKSVGFGLNYGMKEGKLARSLGITKQAALEIINAYLGTYPAVSGFYEDAIAETEQTGFSFTLLGRRRFHPAIHSHNKMDRWSEQRKCVNNQIQGTAADAVRLSMINIWKAGFDKKYGCKMLLQVHDELIFECPKETAQQAKAEIQAIMEHPFPTDLLVPLDVSIATGPAWNKAH